MLQEEPLQGILLHSKYQDAINCPSEIKATKGRIAKKKIELDLGTDVDQILEKIQKKYTKYDLDTRDGVKIHFDKEWVHLRKSNTEPIIRIYSESQSESTADNLAQKIMMDIKELITAQTLTLK